MKGKYMIIISFDAVSSEDLDIMKKLPNFKKLIEEGSLIKNVESIYPTLTYPAHVTIVTGRHPKKHGIIDNTIFKPGDFSPNWYWYRKYIIGETIYDLAKEKGLKTCTLLWPVTGRSDVDYNLTEIFKTKPYHNQYIQSGTSGSLLFQLKLNKKFGHLRNGISQPSLDNFVTESAKYVIDKYTPDLMLIHFTDVDTNRHNYGYRSEEALNALVRHDIRLGEIIEVLKKKGIYDKTNIIALGDHSAMDVDKIIKLNSLFKEQGLIKCSKDRKFISYDAICKSLDGSAYIYLKDPKDSVVKKEVENLLKDVMNMKEKPIEFILKDKEIEDVGADTKASFMIEASSGFYFVDDIYGDVLEKINHEEAGNLPHRYKAIHGYSPKKENYGTFFIGRGKNFKKGIVLEEGKIINHGPTLARILGVELKDCDGEVVEEILEK
ncbi:ectonucleotide pyrophosphatase/phosphodiesterase [Clostridium sp. SHJSY1]|uniref:alkaline phosphatase family protein n=1 Tax=Clostridium sp. SHJSY1 TaxID=2942483 RepID=UPI002877159E|nr:ectonucleotide pyrophosphatase/phosphodiesterase [Clostridium sp. SHJSY1]MDS0524468.1 ectonucleotide pyrophosphatase/phosphodiesterase [Clostridium sp. SHJSY1]